MERVISIEITVTDYRAMNEEDALTALLTGLRQTMPDKTMRCIDKARARSTMQFNRPGIREIAPSLFDEIDGNTTAKKRVA